jgi:hypothetical protein
MIQVVVRIDQKINRFLRYSLDILNKTFSLPGGYQGINGHEKVFADNDPGIGAKTVFR